MKSEKNIHRSGQARLTQALRRTEKILSIIENHPQITLLTDADVADLRDFSADLGQYLAEVNAYRNALELNDADTKIE